MSNQYSENKDLLLKARILVAEDNPINQMLFRVQLTRLGYQVFIVPNGREAVRAIASDEKYDLVLMDCQMPEMDGYTAAHAIRELCGENSKKIPIIAVTAHCLDDNKMRCLNAGMDDYLSKPISLDFLKQAIESYIKPHSLSVGAS